MKRIVLSMMLVAGFSMAQDPVKVENHNGATTIGVDVMSKPSATVQFLKNNWGKILASVGVAVAVDRVAENNGWLWYERKSESTAQTPKINPASSTQVSGGNASQTTITASDNSTVNITIVEGAAGE